MPSTMMLRLIGASIAAVLIAGFVLSWFDRGRKIEALENWQVAVQVAVTDATVEPDKKGVRKLVNVETVVPAINALKRSLDNCAGELDNISERSLAAEKVSNVLDQGLADLLKEQGKQAASMNRRLESLANRKSTGNAAADCEAMDADSAAAWNGWSN